MITTIVTRLRTDNIVWASRVVEGTLRLALVVLVLVPLVATAASTVEAEIIEITDGDTVKAMVGDRIVWKVRLAEIDAPEMDQPWGKRAKQALSAKIFAKKVRIIVAGKDRYGRWIGWIYLEERNINREMVLDGHAWAYRKYLKDRTLIDAESTARRKRQGLWSLLESQQTAPWKWRRMGSRQSPHSSNDSHTYPECHPPSRHHRLTVTGLND